MAASLRPRAKVVLQELLHAATETLYDGTLYLHPSTRRSRAVIDAQTALHEFSKAINNNLLDDETQFQEMLVSLDKAFSDLAKLGIEPTTLLVRRDYASAKDDQRTQSIRPMPSVQPRARPRLISDNSVST